MGDRNKDCNGDLELTNSELSVGVFFLILFMFEATLASFALGPMPAEMETLVI